MIRNSFRRLVGRSPITSALSNVPRYCIRMNSSLSSEPKQFKRSTLPSSSSMPSPTQTTITSKEKTDKGTQKTTETELFASHMDDLKATKCVNHLISDNNDLPLSLSITESASSKLQDLISTENTPNAALKIKVESGGCHGFQYDLQLIDDYTAEFNPEEDETMFVRDGVARVIIDKTSLEILRDSKVDYVHELIGSQFKVVDSPYTTSACGCGSSFDFDFDKLNESSSN